MRRMDGLSAFMLEQESTGAYMHTLKIAILDQKEAYVDDEAKDFMKVSTNGNIKMTTGKDSKDLTVNGVIILTKVGSSWKITETTNPWG